MKLSFVTVALLATIAAVSAQFPAQAAHAKAVDLHNSKQQHNKHRHNQQKENKGHGKVRQHNEKSCRKKEPKHKNCPPLRPSPCTVTKTVILTPGMPSKEHYPEPEKYEPMKEKEREQEDQKNEKNKKHDYNYNEPIYYGNNWKNGMPRA